MSETNPSDEKAVKPATNIYDAILQVFIEAIQRGALVPLLLAVVVVVLWLGTLWVLPEGSRPEHVKLFLLQLKHFWWTGYGLSIFIILAWYFHWRWFKARWNGEMDRLAEERNRWQSITYELKAAIESMEARLPDVRGRNQLDGLESSSADRPQIKSSTDTPSSPVLFDNFGEE